MMALVALVAVGIGTNMTFGRWGEYRRLAANHAWSERSFRSWADANRRDQKEEVRSIVRTYDGLADHHGRKRAEYERAARRQWLPAD
jgi:hypothetical protein